MKKQRSGNQKVINLVYLALALFLISWICLWGRNSFFNYWKGERDNKRMSREIARIDTENDSLIRAGNRLRSDPAAAEKVAREQHGLIKEGEVIWRFKPAQSDTLTKAK